MSLILLLGGCARINVQGLADNSYKPSAGLMYKLPRTCIAFKISVKTTTYTRSECFNTNIDKIPPTIDKKIIEKLKNNEEVSARKITGIEVLTMPVDDPDKFFVVETNAKAFQDRTYGVTLSSQGFMTNSTMEVKDNTFDIATQFVSSAASFISPIALKRAPGADDAGLKVFCKQQADSYEQLQKDKYDFFRLRSMPVGIDFPDADLYTKVLAEYDKTEIQLFNNAFFTTEVATNSCIIYYTPTKDTTEIKNGKLFKYDAAKDVLVINEKLPGEIRLQNNGVTTVKFEDLTNENDDKTLRYINIEPEAIAVNTVNGRLSDISGGTAKGLRYNIPRQCVLSLYKTGELPSVKGTLQLPQWGTVGRLNEKLSKISLVLNPETGALISATLESKGLTAEQVKNAMNAASGFRDLFMRDKDAEALAKIDKKIKMLEAQDKLDKLEEEEATELIALRKEADLLTEKKKVAELRAALKKLEEEQ